MHDLADGGATPAVVEPAGVPTQDGAVADPTIDHGRPDRSVRLLDGPGPDAGGESLGQHRARLGDVGTARFTGWELIDELDRSGLLGRGGAGFPVGRKWRSVADRSAGLAVVVANGAEGEPRSAKDRVLMTLRPHLVLDGAILAADAVGADEAIVYVGTEHGPALTALRRAIAERGAWSAIEARGARGRSGQPMASLRLVEAPVGYVSGESSAVVHYINARDARPTTVPPRTFERGVGGHPTVVQNVESLAHAALIARFWERVVPRGRHRPDARHCARHRVGSGRGSGRPGDRVRHDAR